MGSPFDILSGDPDTRRNLSSRRDNACERADPNLRTSVFFLILIVLTSGITLAVAQYGEDSTSLGQFVDEFTSSDNISVTVEVIRNSTLDVMELNFSADVPVWTHYNFTAFNEIDVGVLTVQDDDIEWINMDRDITAYVYQDFGVAGFSGDWTFNFSSKMIHDTDRGSAYVFGLTNVTGNDLRTLIVANNEIVNCRWFDIVGSALHRFSMEFYLNGALQGDVNRNRDSMTNNVEYWFLIEKTGLVVNCTIFSDSGFSVHVGNVWNTLDKEYNFRYLYAVSSHNSANSNWNSDGKVFHLSYLNVSIGGYSSDGYFSTTDYLDEVNGSTLALMTQSRLFANTHITVQVSEDNATWGDAEGIPGDSYDLSGGLETIDLRPWNESSSVYIMYNLTSTDSDFTPYLNQSRLITTEGIPVIQNVSGVWEYFNASAIGVTTGTLDAGALVNVSTMDGTYYNVSEVVGIPGFYISFNFTAIPDDADCLWLVLNTFYDGNQVHDLDIDLWNFTGSSWETIGHIPDQTEFGWINSTIYDLRIPNDYVTATGEVRGRIYHLSSGNINHDIAIEFLNIYAEIPSIVTPSVGGDVDVSIFIALAIILSCITYLLAREKI